MKICLIGSTGHWRLALDAVPGEGRDQIIGVAAGSSGETMDQVAEHCGRAGHAARVFEDYRKMLDILNPDVVSVACRFHDHAKVARHVLERGIHLFIEKPVALTLKDLAGVREVHAKAGALLAAMLTLRYEPAFLAAWQAVQAGAVGEVRLVTAQKSYKLGTRADYYKTRKTYGGTIPWVGSHSIDLLAWFAGLPFKTVFAAHSTRSNRDHGELEATALCLFTFENEVIGSTNIDFLRPSTAPSHEDDRIRIAGTDGVIEVHDGQAFLINGRAKGVQAVEVREKRHFFADFLKQVRGEGTCLVNAHDSFRMTEACLMARQSADEGRLVQFRADEEQST